jgi:hypothetical protein
MYCVVCPIQDLKYMSQRIAQLWYVYGCLYGLVSDRCGSLRLPSLLTRAFLVADSFA